MRLPTRQDGVENRDKVYFTLKPEPFINARNKSGKKAMNCSPKHWTYFKTNGGFSLVDSL